MGGNHGPSHGLRRVGGAQRGHYTRGDRGLPTVLPLWPRTHRRNGSLRSASARTRPGTGPPIPDLPHRPRIRPEGLRRLTDVSELRPQYCRHESRRGTLSGPFRSLSLRFDQLQKQIVRIASNSDPSERSYLHRLFADRYDPCTAGLYFLEQPIQALNAQLDQRRPWVLHPRVERAPVDILKLDKVQRHTTGNLHSAMTELRTRSPCRIGKQSVRVERGIHVLGKPECLLVKRSSLLRVRYRHFHSAAQNVPIGRSRGVFRLRQLDDKSIRVLNEQRTRPARNFRGFRARRQDFGAFLLQ